MSIRLVVGQLAWFEDLTRKTSFFPLRLRRVGLIVQVWMPSKWFRFSDTCDRKYFNWHYHKEGEPGSESAAQSHLGSFGGTGQPQIPSKNAALLQLWLFLRPGTQQLYCRGICAWLIDWLIDWLIESCPSKRSQAPLRFWVGPSFPLVCYKVLPCFFSPSSITPGVKGGVQAQTTSESSWLNFLSFTESPSTTPTLEFLWRMAGHTSTSKRCCSLSFYLS